MPQTEYLPTDFLYLTAFKHSLPFSLLASLMSGRTNDKIWITPYGIMFTCHHHQTLDQNSLFIISETQLSRKTTTKIILKFIVLLLSNLQYCTKIIQWNTVNYTCRSIIIKHLHYIRAVDVQKILCKNTAIILVLENLAWWNSDETIVEISSPLILRTFPRNVFSAPFPTHSP